MTLQHSNTPTTQSLVSVLNPAVGETIAHSRAQHQQRRKSCQPSTKVCTLPGNETYPAFTSVAFSFRKCFAASGPVSIIKAQYHLYYGG